MIQGIDLTVQAGSFTLRNVNFDVPTGKYCVLMGRTGSGKTTLLEAVCGLKRVVSGRILLDDRDVTDLKPPDRGIGFVPQDGALFRTKTVRQHLQFALMIRRWPRAAINERVDELAEMLGIHHLLHRDTHGLSGGERQRVAMGRALAFRPQILCLDEPLSALDDETRHSMIDLLKRVQHDTGVTALHVTHHRTEAELLADYRLDLLDGELVQYEPEAVE